MSSQQQSTPSSLELKRVTLFTSPLAYFQHSSSPASAISLDVPLKQRDLIVDTLSVNVPSSINYSGAELGRGEDDDAEDLFRFGLGSFGEIFSSLVGSNVSIVRKEGDGSTGSTFTGIIVSVDKKRRPIGNSTSQDTFEEVWHSVSLLDRLVIGAGRSISYHVPGILH